ncbi:ZU5 domain-containing protein [Chitinophaga costaii]|uniref:ZU5 domain-containing protein n=1 Tax=Chitinophaga costaii TaxID=1335309 RepID=A0A1C4BAQ8_9BACT|nr:hypothetical protein [Chitinophaga costaii]SCC03864.1 ZU5 domain-containing protein [Chitinophaga costaii]
MHGKPADPIKTAPGQLMGTATKATIGAAGGVIAMPDQYISVQIPAGAVDANTEFSIQEVTPNEAVSTGRLFRILPEGIILKKPVEITFRYTDADIDGGGEDYLYPCYQSSNGVWHKVMDCTLDKGNKTLKVATTHFSDWSCFREIDIHAQKEEIGSKEEVELSVFAMDSYKENEQSEDLVLTAIPLTSDKIVAWKVVSGGGTISGDKSAKVKYTAPATDSKTEVMIEVTVKNVLSQSDPRRPGNGGLSIVRKKITILPEEYVIWTIGGKKYTGMFFALGVFDGHAIMTATAVDNEMSFHTNGTKLGKYSFGELDDPKTSTFSGTDGYVTYNSDYTECVTFKKVVGEGAVVFETFGESGGGIVQGTFEGTLYKIKNCEVTNRHIVGSFRVKRTY